ncbi:hypothetical protein TetV_129 [Tetraselmis virus 1]|uniref:Uncharacterized protein n=1 Tax=Tetraselmis virus 1 TaxID=2060617 RepID=A0A2P0VMV2_9VIRU|nr:hypothetical protein QJ968_gp129 [Tetraselmis virus 1]AUF82221.1 hypothetical protein TetV_129 [Tetraselmis virus 1]
MSLSFINNSGQSQTGGGSAELDYISLTENASTEVGFGAGDNNDTGTKNTTIGYEAAGSGNAVSGNSTVLVGYRAGYNNQGSYNTWVGTEAGYENLTGTQNTGVGYRSGYNIIDQDGNSFLGFESGYASIGAGNTFIGYKAGGGDTIFSTECNISLGSYTLATGGECIAIGPSTDVSGNSAIAMGSTTTVLSDNSIAIGQNLTVSGLNSLIINPRPDGTASTHSKNEELNIFGILTGEREAEDTYSISLDAQKILINNDVNYISMSRFGIELYSDKNMTVLTPTSYTSPVTFSDAVTCSDTLVCTNGFRVSLGTTIFDDPVIFNDSVQFTICNVTVETSTALVMNTRDLTVTDNATFCNNARFLGTTVLEGNTTVNGQFILNDTFEVLGNVDVDQDLTVIGTTTSGILNSPVADLTNATVSNINITGSITFPPGFSFGDDETGGNALVGSNLTLDTLTINSNLLVKGTTSNAGTVIFEDLRTNLLRVDQNLQVLGTVNFDDDIHVGETVHSKLVMTEDLVSDDFVTGQITATTATIDTVNAVTQVVSTSLTAPTITATTANITSISAQTASFSNLSFDDVTATTVNSTNGNFDVITVNTTANLPAFSAASVSGTTGTFDTLTVNNTANLPAFSATSVSGVTGSFDDIVVSDSAQVQNAFFNSASASNAVVDTLTVNTTANLPAFSATSVSGVTGSFDDIVVSDSAQVQNAFFNSASASNAVVDTLTVNTTANLPAFNAATASFEESSASNASVSNIVVEDYLEMINTAATDPNSKWTMQLNNEGYGNPDYADFTIKSWTGTTFKLTETFEAGVLNFTGKHRCITENKDLEKGMLVVTTGNYYGLNGETSPEIDESIPTVKIATKPRDNKAFGVVASYEGEGPFRIYTLANAMFSTEKMNPHETRVIINSVGEGGLWVCDANGQIFNGDLLTTSHIAGHAQRQTDDVIRSTTVAKVTGDPITWEHYFDAHSGKECFRSFVGVVYKF